VEPCLVTGLPHHRTIAALDIEQSTTCTDPVKADLRDKMYGLFDEDRLLDAPPVKKALRMSSGPLALVVSGDIYRSVVHHGYNGVDRNSFREAVCIHIAGYRYPGCIHIPSEGASYRVTEMANYRQIA
jgi:hypothetical protein